MERVNASTPETSQRDWEKAFKKEAALFALDRAIKAVEALQPNRSDFTKHGPRWFSEFAKAEQYHVERVVCLREVRDQLKSL